MGGEVVPDMFVVEAKCHVAFFYWGGKDIGSPYGIRRVGYDS